MSSAEPSVEPFVNASEAAKRLGVSTKALRIYEQRGLLSPARTAAGYRVYGPDEMHRAREIVSLRALGLSLEQVARVLEGEPRSLELGLAAHEATLDGELRKLMSTLERVRSIRGALARGQAPATGEVSRLLRPDEALSVAFDLPWPWGGERFEYGDVRAINYIVGPLGSGKTRLAQRIAETLPGAVYLGLERLDDGGAAAVARVTADSDLQLRVDHALAWLVDEGAVASEALIALLAGLEADGPTVLVVDMVEQGLDQPTQEALITLLRQRARRWARPLFLMTRSSSILNLADVGPDEAILLCPANHGVPTRVAPYPGSPGLEAIATCLASPDVRARTAGTIAYRPPATGVASGQ